MLTDINGTQPVFSHIDMTNSIIGVASGATYDPDIDLLYEDFTGITVKRAAVYGQETKP